MHSESNEQAKEFISLAESMFGAMTSDWRYRGVEFHDSPPCLAYYPEEGEVAISLSLKAIDDEVQRSFQLSHEVCHLLYPTAYKQSATVAKTIVINEGISTFFSIIILSRLYGDEVACNAIENLMNNSPNYFSAFTKVMKLIKGDQDAVKKIRAIQPKINDLTKSDLQSAGLQLTDEEIDSLITKF